MDFSKVVSWEPRNRARHQGTGLINSFDTFVSNIYSFYLNTVFYLDTILDSYLDHLIKNYNLKSLKMTGKEKRQSKSQNKFSFPVASSHGKCSMKTRV